MSWEKAHQHIYCPTPDFVAAALDQVRRRGRGRTGLQPISAGGNSLGRVATIVLEHSGCCPR